jgi:hypothetical protein
MPRVVLILLAFITTLFRSHLAMQMELIALRHQVAVYQQSISRPKLQSANRLLLQRHLIFSHVLSFICLSHNDPTVLDQDEWEPS